MEEKEPVSPAAPVRKKRHFIIWVLLIAFALLLFGQLLGLLISDLVASRIPNASDSVIFLFQYLSFIGIHILTLLYCALFEKDLFRSFFSPGRGGGKGNTLGMFGLGLLIGFVMNGLCILLAWLHGDLDFSVGAFQPLYLLAALLVVCVQSAAEELIDRGYIQGALCQRYKPWVAIVVNSVFFMSLHLSNPGVSILALAEILTIGLALSLVTYCLDSLWMAAAIHTAWNFTQNFLFGLPNSGIVSQGSFLHLEAAKGSFFYDPGFGVEGSFPSVAVSVLLGVGVLLYVRRRRGA